MKENFYLKNKIIYIEIKILYNTFITEFNHLLLFLEDKVTGDGSSKFFLFDESFVLFVCNNSPRPKISSSSCRSNLNFLN